MKIVKALTAAGLALTTISAQALANDKVYVDKDQHTLATQVIYGNMGELSRIVFCDDGTVVYGNGSAFTSQQPDSEKARQNLRDQCKIAGFEPKF